MLFNSIQFLCFFPLVTLLYFLIPHKYRWIWLLFASYYFYMSWNAKYALLIGTSTVITYLSGILISHSNQLANPSKKRLQRRLWVALSFVLNLSILFFFKYFDFAIDNINWLLGHANITLITKPFDVILPVGISFYTFQALSYTMDVYRGEIYAEKNLAKYALFVSFFPQLVAGPIERSKNLLIQINERHCVDYNRMKNGLLLMLWGYFQKIVIADRAAILVDHVYNDYTAFGGLALVVATLFFTIQIYCDFAGYSHIAIGAAQVMGFRLMQNFRQPYFSNSIQDFWRRWHISLSTWFRDYLYIPLGGSRCGRVKKYRNLLVTFLASGLWHGASWNYIIWGGLHGAYQVLGDILKPFRQKCLKLLRVNTHAQSHYLLQCFMTFCMVVFGWIFFRAPGARAAFRIIAKIISPDVLTNISSIGLPASDLIVLIIAIMAMFSVEWVHQRISLRSLLARQNLWFRWAVYLLAIHVVLIFGVYGPEYNASQFIYFQF